MEMSKSETIAIIRSLLSSTNSCYSIFKLNGDFKNETGIDIPLFGYNNISDFLQSIPDTVKVTGIYPIQQVSLVSNEKSAHIVSLVKRQRNKEQKKRSFPNGKSIPRKFLVDIRNKEIQELQTCERKTTSVTLEGQNDNFNNESTTCGVKLKEANADLTFPSNYIDRCNSLSNCWNNDESIPHIEVKFHAQVGSYIEVFPCQIFSPHKFYFHFRKFKKKFADFMDDLQIFYGMQKGIPTITEELIRPKLICAAFYKTHTESMWHRAEVHKVINSSEVIVNLIDNGNMVKISKENLKYLHQNFMLLPRQAVLGSLANIIPSKQNSDWSHSAIKRFFDLSFQKDLIAGVVYVDPKVFCINVALSCTKGVEIHINDTLVKEGYAEFDIDLLDSHFADILKMATSWKTKGNCKECKSDKEKYRNKFADGMMNPLEENVSTKYRTPVFYFSNNYDNNRRLKDMFSSVDKKMY